MDSIRPELRRSARVCLLLALSLAACAASAEEISQAEVQRGLSADTPSLLVVDVRSRAEFERGHIPGALHLPHDEPDRLLATLAPHRERTIVTYCQSGGRAGRVNRALSEAGFPDVRHLSGDFPGWTRAGLPTSR